MFSFLSLSECFIEIDAVACTPFIMFLLPRKGQHKHTQRHRAVVVRIECTLWDVQY